MGVLLHLNNSALIAKNCSQFYKNKSPLCISTVGTWVPLQSNLNQKSLCWILHVTQHTLSLVVWFKVWCIRYWLIEMFPNCSQWKRHFDASAISILVPKVYFVTWRWGASTPLAGVPLTDSSPLISTFGSGCLALEYFRVIPLAFPWGFLPGPGLLFFWFWISSCLCFHFLQFSLTGLCQAARSRGSASEVGF